jgi:hypothetical protein
VKKADALKGRTVPAVATIAPNVTAGERGRVERWLIDLLLANGGALPAPVVKAEAAAAGISERTLERARPGIASSVRRGFGEGALWNLIHQ